MRNMFFFLKSLSRLVHDDEEPQEQPELSKTDGGSNDDDLCTSLTVWRKSLLISCNGFMVIDSNGNLVYRVDKYVGGCPKELVLMDGKGNSILTMRCCKNLRLVEIKRKDATSGGICFGLDVFVLIIKAGFDPGFAMALVILLDQMLS
ncbi:hypothetical protein J1N35_040857 [Gossypium stocksii]|uniref:Uncharacterized protein n=1 Tax=Gossypium stocksii TaxID=47602 RepID=A0A9D3UEX7_9ROSI|nr:hypothetical protein J1N35_040857 [Gossypium stocksii]